MPQTKEQVLKGAAFRAIFDKTDPNGCTTHNKYADLLTALSNIEEWTLTQEPEVRDAYKSAIPEIRIHAETVLENNVRYRALMSAFDTIPKP